MTNNNQNMPNVPNLRFKGFEGDWIRVKLEDIGEFKNGINKSSEDFGHGVPFINLMDVFGRPSICNNKNLGLVNASKKEIDSYELRKGDVLFIRSSVKKSGVGETSVIMDDLPQTVYSGFLIKFRDTKINLDIDFKKYCFSSPKFRNDLVSLSSTSANTNINQESLNSLNLSLPQKNEQIKISKLLSLVDLKIQTQSKIIERLETSIKNLREKVFSQEIRFKDGNNIPFSDWDKKKLKDIAQKRIVKNRELKIQLVLTNSATQGIINQRDFFDKDIANKNNINGYYIVEKGDFVYNPRISNEAPVGPISRNKVDTGIMSPLYMVFRFNKVNLDFIEQFYKTKIWHKHMENISNFGARADRMSFLSNDFFEMPLLLPCGMEQKTIANFLFSFTYKVELEKQILVKYENQKKYLLRNLFI